MDSYRRVVDFVRWQLTDRPPFMPLFGNSAAKYSGTYHKMFADDSGARAAACIECADIFKLDCLLPVADVYEQLEGYGMPLEYRYNTYHGKPFIRELGASYELGVPDIYSGRTGAFIDTIRRIAEKEKGKRYIFGGCVGPFTLFSLARGQKEAIADLEADEDTVREYLEMFFIGCMRFIEAQLNAGADGIQIFDPACTAIDQETYRRISGSLHGSMCERIQLKEDGFAWLHFGGKARLHMKYMVETGARIIGLDSSVNLEFATMMLERGQVFAGNLNPDRDLLDKTSYEVRELVVDLYKRTENHTIISTETEIPQDVDEAIIRDFYESCSELQRFSALKIISEDGEDEVDDDDEDEDDE